MAVGVTRADSTDSAACQLFARRVDRALEAERASDDRREEFLRLARAEPSECDTFQPRLLPVDGDARLSPALALWERTLLYAH